MKSFEQKINNANKNVKKFERLTILEPYILNRLSKALDETAKINIVGTINALIVSKKYGVKRFIFASSIYANTEEGGFYGSSKKAAEDYIERFHKTLGLNFNILRLNKDLPCSNPVNSLNMRII